MLNPKIIFILPSKGAGGGSNSVVQEAMALHKMGLKASIAVDAKNYVRFITNYPELQAQRVEIVSFSTSENWARL